MKCCICGKELKDKNWIKSLGGDSHLNCWDEFLNKREFSEISGKEPSEPKKVEPTKIVMAELKTRYEQIDRLTHELKTLQSQYDEQTKAFEELLKKNAELMRENERLTTSCNNLARLNKEIGEISKDACARNIEFICELNKQSNELSALKESKTVYVKRYGNKLTDEFGL